MTFLNESGNTATKPFVLWFTGLSGAGKTSIATAMKYRLETTFSIHPVILDGDQLRDGLCRDLGFSGADRDENTRRAAEVCKLLFDSGLTTLATFMSPKSKQRNFAKSLFPQSSFIEIFVDTPQCVCEARDPKGLYARARDGHLENFIGIGDLIYEAPENPDIHLENGMQTIDEAVSQIINSLIQRDHLPRQK